jgi:hypothetical protein
MLGEIIYEAKGKVTSLRVLSVEGAIPKIENTISQNGSLRGNTEITLTVTYWSVPRLPSSTEGQATGGVGQTVLYAEGQGVLTTKDGSEMATWTGQRIAHVYGNKRTDRGSVFCSTPSKGKLAFLNNIVGVFEYEANLEDGIAEGKVWEWK